MKFNHAWYTVNGFVSRLLFQVAIMAPDSSYVPYAIACFVVDALGILTTVKLVRRVIKHKAKLALIFAERERRRNKGEK